MAARLKRKYLFPTVFLVTGVTVGGLWKWRSDQKIAEEAKSLEVMTLEENASPSFGVYSIQGKRDHMEDRYVCMPDLSKETGILMDSKVSLFGVFDGHGGDVSSTFVALQFPFVLAKSLKDEIHLQRGNTIPERLQSSLLETHEQLLEEHPNKYPRDGTTAIVCCINGEILYTANVGDSRAVLSRGGHAIDLSRDHKADDPIEKQRIEAQGGIVRKRRSCARVYYPDIGGGLAMSRALGDEFYKIEGRVLVPCDADITQNVLQHDDEYIILASDGLWDVMSSEYTVRYIHHLKSTNREIDAEMIAKSLVQEAYDRLSTDNITVLVVDLSNFQKKE